MTSNTRYKIALRATIVNSSVNTLLALAKIAIGFVGHSQALIADGVHSFSDLITDLLVLFAAKLGAEHPDDEHPYGHRRIETIAAILVSIVLMGVALGIAYDTIDAFHKGAGLIPPSLPVILVAFLSILANEGLYRYTLKAGNRINSDLLRTNAWHNRSDALVSLIVLISVAGTWLGLSYLDAIGALVIAALILRMGLKMIWRSTQELIDAAVDPELLSEIKSHIRETPGVVSVHQLRTRSHGGNVFVDVHIQVNPFISVSEGHYISEQVHLNLIKDFDSVEDVTVHIDPEDDEKHHLSGALPIRQTIEDTLEAAWQDLPHHTHIQKKVLHYIHGKLSVDIFLPLNTIDHIDPQALTEQYRKAAASIPYLENVTLYYS